MNLDIKVRTNGDSSIMILFDSPISEQLCCQIHGLANEITQQLGGQLEQVIPAYQSILLIFNPLITNHNFLNQQLKSLISSKPKVAKLSERVIEIPVCYEPPYSPDLEYLSGRIKLSKAEIIQRHKQVKYRVQMLGFSPGFLYLGGLDKQLYCPRKNIPAIKIAPGSVGIGGQQTGIYPQATPGGWQIIGRTPIKLFDPNNKKPAVAQPLDQVQFVAIDSATFEQLDEFSL